MDRRRSTNSELRRYTTAVVYQALSTARCSRAGKLATADVMFDVKHGRRHVCTLWPGISDVIVTQQGAAWI